MNERKENLKRRLLYVIKAAICAFIVMLGAYIFTCEGFDSYYSTKTYDVVAEMKNGQVTFTSKGNHLAWAKNVDGKVQNLDMLVERGREYTIDLEDFEAKYNEEIASSPDFSLSSVNLHFIYTWITLPSIILLVFRTIFMFVAVFMLCYAVFNLEKGVGLIKQGGAVRWPAALTMSAEVLLYFNPLSENNHNLDIFNRYIGYGVVVNYDINKIIGNFTKWTGAFVGLAFLYMIFFRIYGEKIASENDRKCWDFAHRFFILAMILTAIRYVRFFGNEKDINPFVYSTSLVNLILLTFFGYYLFRLSRKISFHKYVWILLAVNSASLPIAIELNDTWADGKTLFAVQVVITLLTIVFFCFSPLRLEDEDPGKNIPTWCGIFFSIIPLATSIYIEFIAILNQHGIFIAEVRKFYLLGIGLILLLAVLPPAIIKKLRALPIDVKTVCYPILVAGVSALSVQPALSKAFEADLYETANYSVLISDFLNHRTVPIVEHYGGHMMTGVWEGILYGLLNKDVFGGSLSPYYDCITILITLCFFFLLKNVWDEDMAFFGALLFPFSGYWDYYGLGMLIALAILAFAKKNTLGRGIWIWIAFGWVTLYRLDMGTAFGIAAIVTLVAYCITNKSKEAAKKLAISFVIVAVVAFLAWIIICLANYVNPVTRLFEFIKASASNQTWARDTLGDASKADFSWGYIFIPMGMTLGLGYTLISKRFREDAGEDRYLLLILFGASYVANIQRSLVRHTLAVGNYSVVLWSSLIFTALFVSVKKNRNTFLPAFGAMIIFAGLLGSQDAYAEHSIIENATTTLSAHIDTWVVDRISLEDATNELESLTPWEVTAYQGTIIDRAYLTEESQEKIGMFVDAMHTLLDEGETFLDFDNHTFLYSAVGCENPVYVSQSPMQISGEFMQQQFINEAEGANVPFAVLPATGESSFASVRLDGLENASRYYMISEYIYNHFVPFCSMGEYAVWVRPDRYEEKKSKIENLEEVEQLENLQAGFSFANMEIDYTDEGMVLTAVKGDPFISGLENCINLTDYVGGTVKITVDYNTTAHGNFQIYYTTFEDESYSEEKAVKEYVSGSGTVDLYIPVTKYTKLRLDIPEGTEFTIKSFRTSSSLMMIDYGYDIFGKEEGNDNLLTDKSAHLYDLRDLPRIWGEKDAFDTSSGEVLIDMEESEGVYRSNEIKKLDKSEENYLLMEITYSGRDEITADDDDEKVDAVLRAGKKDGNGIVENARYSFYIDEGTHTYLIRLSSDYYWRLGELNTFRLDAGEGVSVRAMRIL